MGLAPGCRELGILRLLFPAATFFLLPATPGFLSLPGFLASTLLFRIVEVRFILRIE